MLLLDKPAGFTSHDAIARTRRALGTRRVGHMGTLDPFATGLLVLLVGRVTRLASYIEGEPKVYDATIRFGTETATDDLTGLATIPGPVPDLADVTSVIPQLTGALEQQPPAFSAKQVDGVRAYDAARRGAPVTLRPASVIVHEWAIRAWRAEGELDVTIACGGGTYIRALARDLGRLAGSAAHLAALRRIRSGPFDVAQAVPLAELGPTTPLRSPLDGLASLPAIPLGADDRLRVSRGQSIDARDPGARAVLTDDAGAVVAVADRQGDSWAPRVVLRDA